MFWGTCLGEKVVKRVAFENKKIENGIKIKLFIKVRHGDPLKTVPGSGLEQIWKINEIPIGKSGFLEAKNMLKVFVFR